MIIKCKGCGKEWQGRDECEAEAKTSIEPCECDEKLSKLSLEELRKLAIKESG